MCGIVGILNTQGAPASPVVVRAMATAIAHRGPDGEGVFTDGRVALGHRRLAILDLTPAGRQPMLTSDARYALTYNGEIYNYQELRAELQAAGRRFHSTGDAEVLLQAYAEWGPACVERLNGMFAFGVWDSREQTLFLARDRYGIKPLYVATVGETLLFGSEIKAFLQHPAFSVRVDLPHLLEYFTFQNILSEGTLFEGVKLLPPGHTLTIRPGQEPEQRRYWDFRFREPAQPLSAEEYVEELDRLFRQAVQRQLVSDAPLGAYLSGGMDSGSITAIAAGSIRGMPTFTCGFDLTSASGLELAYDERTKAEALSYHCRTEHYEVVLKAGDMERSLSDVVWHLEDLRVGQCYPNFFVARLASKFCKSVLAGTGGDELFAGYPWRYYRAVVNDDFEHYVEKYYRFWHRLIPNSMIKKLFVPQAWAPISDLMTIDIFSDKLKEASPAPPTSPEEYVNRSLYFEAKTFLHGLLVVEDRLSMAHGLETRVPFLDNDLVDFALCVPISQKLRELGEIVRLNENEPGPKTEKYFNKTRDGKLILRRVMERYVPHDVTNQIKQGFSGPDGSWFKGDSIDFVNRVVQDDRSRVYEFFRKDTVRSLVQEHLSGTANRRLFIWSLLCFENWLQRFT